MREFVLSAWALFLGVLRRYYFLLFALLLDPIDLYGRYRPDGWPDMPIPEWTIWAAFWATLALAILLTFHEVRVKGVRREPVPDMPLKEAIAYIANRARWSAENKSNDDWVFDLQKDIKDKLRLGRVQAFGRPMHGAEKPAGFDSAMQDIKKCHWKEFDPQVFDIVMGSDESRSTSLTGQGSGFYDVHVDAGQVRDTWPSKRLIRRALFGKGLWKK